MNIPGMQNPIIIALLIALAPAVQAGANDKAAKTTSTQSAPELSLSEKKSQDEKKNFADKKPGDDHHYLRCWQYGRLIFEEAITTLPPDLNGGDVVFTGKADHKTTLYLFDTKGGATCLVK